MPPNKRGVYLCVPKVLLQSDNANEFRIVLASGRAEQDCFRFTYGERDKLLSGFGVIAKRDIASRDIPLGFCLELF